jgi:hypothetical protein
MSMRMVKPSSSSERQTRTTVDTLELTPKIVNSWKLPPFQRELKMNAKVEDVTREIQGSRGVVPGILTVGVLDGETYIVDGQHRIAAWLATGLPLGYADVRMHWFESLGDMAVEFVRLNTALVKLRPDDILRGLEPSTPALQKIRRKCVFIGYDMVRRSEKAPVLSMSIFVRTWAGTRAEVPSAPGSQDALKTFDEAETDAAIDFALLCFEAWHRDRSYARLWASLNLTLCAWLYRRMVLGFGRPKGQQRAQFTRDEFRKCLMALSADGQYLDYLVGRNVGDRDRAPAYSRVKAIFQRRYLADTGKQVRLPAPAWSHV